MTRLRRRERDFDRSAIAHFAHQDDLGRLTQGSPQPVWIIVKVVSELALIKGGFKFRVNELDRVLKGDNMNRLRLVNLVENGGEGGCFSAACGAGH